MVRSISRLIIMLMLLAIAIEAPDSSASAVSPGAYDPLQDSHLIVRGVLTAAVVDHVTLGDWGVLPRNDPGSTRPMRVTKLTIKLAEVMRGNAPSTWQPPSLISVYSVGSISPLFQVGREYIFCCKFFVKAGKYTTGEGTGMYSKSDSDEWMRVVIDKETTPAEHLRMTEVRSRIAMASLQSVTTSSDVIVRGAIVGIRRATASSQEELTIYTVRVEEQLKGQTPSQKIEFVVPRANASVVPGWFRWVPEQVNVGEQWLLFLRKSELGLYPFAGPNSMLRVDGTSLLFDLAVPSPSDLPGTVEKIKREVASED